MRILAGDFNMSLWVVAREMRQRGLQITFAAAFAWAQPGSSQAKSDSCGMFLIGPAAGAKLSWGPSAFGIRGIADDDRWYDGRSYVHESLPRFVKGQGYVLA